MRLMLLLIGALWPVLGGAQEAGGLPANPSFERLDDQGFAAGWERWPEKSPEAGAVSLDANMSHQGARCLRLHHEHASSYTRGQQALTVEPNARYFFRVWIRGENIVPAVGSMGARLYIEGIGGRDHATERRTGTFPWEELTIGPFDSGAGGQITVMCYLHQATGTAWFDDVQVIKATPDFEKRLRQARMRDRFAADLGQARTLATQVRDAPALRELQDLEARVTTADLPEAVDCRAGPPFFPLHGDLYAAMARLNARRAPGQRPLAVWTGDPFAELPTLGLVPAARPTTISALMGTGERDQAVINLCNLTDQPLALQIAVKGSGHPSAPRLTLRQVVHVQRDKGELLADPLPRLARRDGVHVLPLPPGLWRQLWLDFDSSRSRPGQYRSQITLQAPGLTTVSLPLVAEVLPVSLPATLPLVTWNYSYPHEPLIKDRWAQAQADLVAHHINAYCWPSWLLPWPRFDAAGHLQPLDWSAFDTALQTHGQPQWLLLWPGFEWADNLKLRQNLEPGSALWEARFVQWFRALIAGLRERGFGYDRIAWYLTDEPTTTTRVGQTVTAGQALRQADPRALIVENPYSACPPDLLQQMVPVVDIWCAELQWAKQDLMPFYDQHAKVRWTYQVLGPHAPAFQRHRLSFWDCWRHRLTGQGFWAYADCGGSNWDPFDAGRAGYAVVYDGDAEELIPSKRWEAWREGVEDYTYLWLLQQAAGEQAAPLVKAGVDRLLAQPTPEALSALRAQVLRRLAQSSR